MAFTANTFQFNRGVTTCATNGSGVGTVIHGYKSSDTNAAIVTPGYFPDSIDGATDKIFVGDLLLIVSSDTVTMNKITGLTPFTLGADLFGGAGAPLIAAAPLAATSMNGVQIVGTTLQLEIADATHPGIVTELPQSIGGEKSFVGGVKFLTFGGTPSNLNFYEEYTHNTTFTLGTETTGTIGLVVARIGKLITLRLDTIVTTAGQGAPGNAYIANTVLPARFRPDSLVSGPWRVSNGGTYSAGAILISNTGAISIYNNIDFTTNFTAATINGMYPSVISYTT